MKLLPPVLVLFAFVAGASSGGMFVHVHSKSQKCANISRPVHAIATVSHEVISSEVVIEVYSEKALRAAREAAVAAEKLFDRRGEVMHNDPTPLGITDVIATQDAFDIAEVQNALSYGPLPGEGIVGHTERISAMPAAQRLGIKPLTYHDTDADRPSNWASHQKYPRAAFNDRSLKRTIHAHVPDLAVGQTKGWCLAIPGLTQPDMPLPLGWVAGWRKANSSPCQ